jgi:hypothetical protein
MQRAHAFHFLLTLPCNVPSDVSACAPQWSVVVPPTLQQQLPSCGIQPSQTHTYMLAGMQRSHASHLHLPLPCACLCPQWSVVVPPASQQQLASCGIQPSHIVFTYISPQCALCCVCLCPQWSVVVPPAYHTQVQISSRADHTRSCYSQHPLHHPRGPLLSLCLWPQWSVVVPPASQQQLASCGIQPSHISCRACFTHPTYLHHPAMRLLLCLPACAAVVCGGAASIAAAARILRHTAQSHRQPAAGPAACQQRTQQPRYKSSIAQRHHCCCCCECGGAAVRGVCGIAAGLACAVRSGWLCWAGGPATALAGGVHAHSAAGERARRFLRPVSLRLTADWGATVLSCGACTVMHCVHVLSWTVSAAARLHHTPYDPR